MTQTMHVISHTHWDREWYRPFQVFRARLVEVVDAVLAMLESTPDYRFYHLDGQTIVLDDYLQIRPERAESLKRFIAEGRLLVGPWYTQPDEFLVSGESMVRNLLLGQRAARAFGGCMDIGYLPDSFGHASQMPQIFAGFGFQAAVIFRGITADQVRSAFMWRGADGTALLAIKLPDDDAYSNYLYRLRPTLSDPNPIDYARLDAELARLRSDTESMAVCDQLLWMDGVDHIFPSPKTPEIIAYANQTLAGARVIHSTLPAYVQALTDAAPVLQEQEGELRHANRAWALQSVLANVASSHIEIKQANTAAQTALERVVEPLSALAWMHGAEYPSGFLSQAWQLLMQNHAHDSICGCSVDQVHRDMHYRYDQVQLIASVLRDRALQALAAQVDTQASEGNRKGLPLQEGLQALTAQVDMQAAEPADDVLLVYNPSSWVRDQNVIVDITLPQETLAGELQIVDAAMQVVSHQVLSIRETNRLYQPRFDIPTVNRKRVYRVALQTSLPAYGVASFRVRVVNDPNRPTTMLFTDTSTMENRYLRVAVAPDGTLTVHDKQTGRTYSGLLALEDRGDGGEGWNWIPPQFDHTYSSAGAPFTVARVQDGALRATLRLGVTLQVPAGFVGDAHEHDPKKMRRDDRLVALPIATDISLGIDSRQLELDMTVQNTALNHRLRVLFPTDIAAVSCYADGAFDVVQRPIHQVDSHDWREPQLGTYPHSSFVAIEDAGGAEDAAAGMAVITAGTQEYEVMDESRRTLAITLLRAFGRGPGEPHEYIDSQELGLHSYRFALLPYAGKWEQAGVVQASRQFNQQPLAVMTNGHTGALQANKPLLSITGEGFDVTAVKRTEDRDSLIVRLVNLSQLSQAVRISHAGGVREAYQTNLAEARLQALAVGEGGVVSLLVTPRQIATVEIVRG